MNKTTFYRLLVAIALCGAPLVSAQQPDAALTIFLKDGRTISTSALRRDGNSVMATVSAGTGTGQVGYPISTIERIAFPEPVQIKTASEFLAQGKIGEALGTLSPVVGNLAPFRDVPGSFWTKAAIVHLQALISIGRETEADNLIADMLRSASDPEAVLMARVQQAARSSRKGNPEEALATCDEAIAKSSSDATLAAAWLCKGDSLRELKQWEAALLAYLHLPVFHADQRLLVPAAQLGSARVLTEMQDYPEAAARLESLIQDYPASPAAATARLELAKLKKKQP